MLNSSRLSLRLGNLCFRQQLSTSAILNKDYYKILGVAKNASGKDIKKAYYQLAKKYHPDTNKGEPTAERKFQEVSEAYEVLSDDQKRSEYDSFGGSQSGPKGRGGFGPPGFDGFRQQYDKSNFREGPSQRTQWSYQSNVDPEELFRTIFGEFNRRAGTRSGTFQNPFEEIFSNFNFRGGQEAEAHVSFNDAAKGVTKEVEVMAMSRQAGLHKVKVQVPIPAGISDGQTLRLSLGDGQEVFVTVRVEESDYFRREGQDVHTTASISLSQALLGGVIRVQGLYEDINLRIPAGTSSHAAFTLSGRGIRHMDSHNRFGDHIVHITIALPVRLTEEQKDLIREYAYTEKDTPGTVTGVDKSTAFARAKARVNNYKEEVNTEQSSHSDDAKGTIAKIVDAVKDNETVVKVRKMLGL